MGFYQKQLQRLAHMNISGLGFLFFATSPGMVVKKSYLLGYLHTIPFQKITVKILLNGKAEIGFLIIFNHVGTFFVPNI